MNKNTSLIVLTNFYRLFENTWHYENLIKTFWDTQIDFCKWNVLSNDTYYS